MVGGTKATTNNQVSQQLPLSLSIKPPVKENLHCTKFTNLPIGPPMPPRAFIALPATLPILPIAFPAEL